MEEELYSSLNRPPCFKKWSSMSPWSGWVRTITTLWKQWTVKKKVNPFFLFLCASYFLFLTSHSSACQHTDVLRWCVVSSGEQQKCGDMGSEFQKKGLTPAIKCIYGDSVTDCMKKIKVNPHCGSPPDGQCNTSRNCFGKSKESLWHLWKKDLRLRKSLSTL